MKNNVTIYDIAKRLGISPSTVSRVLNNSSHPVKQEVRERVLAVAKEMDYVLNAQARNLKKQTNPTVGVILPSIANPFYPSIVRGIEDEAMRRNYYIAISSCDKDPRRTDQYVQSMLEQNMRGIIAIYLEYLPQSLANYVQRGGQVISVVTDGVLCENAHNIVVDKVLEARQAVEHLIGLGHRRIANLMNELDSQLRRKRLEGYFTALKNAGIEIKKEYLYIYGQDIPAFGDESAESVKVGYELAQKMLERTPEVTGILCMNDMMALGVIKALRENGKSVPADYSIVSFDDLFFADCIEPSLTTMRVEKYQWGKAMARYLFEILENPGVQSCTETRAQEVLIPSSLVVRGSTAPPRCEN